MSGTTLVKVYPVEDTDNTPLLALSTVLALALAVTLRTPENSVAWPTLVEGLYFCGYFGDGTNLDQISQLDRDPFLVAFFEAAAEAYYEMLNAEQRLSGADDTYQPRAVRGRELPITESHGVSAFSARHRR